MVDGNTKIIGRFHTKPNARGLNIYNPFFQTNGINALYLLFHNPSCRPLVSGLRELNLSGAITSGFELDPLLPELLDKLDKSATTAGKVGIITNKAGVLTGFYRGGSALLKSVTKKINLGGKKIVILGAGIVVKSFLAEINELPVAQQPESIELYNRTQANADNLATNYKLIKKTSVLASIGQSYGDILINISKIGSQADDIFFTDELVKRFTFISDVTFETENTNLISLAKKFDKQYSTGWDMFTYYGVECFRDILEIEIDPGLLREYVSTGLSTIV